MRVDYEVITNLRKPNSRTLGPLTTDELEQQYVFWENKVQKSCGSKTISSDSIYKRTPKVSWSAGDAFKVIIQFICPTSTSFRPSWWKMPIYAPFMGEWG
jgi:hypothetical protein